MGTIATLTTAGADGKRLDEFTATVRTCSADLETTLSVFNADSDVSRLAQGAGGDPITISPATAEILSLSCHYGRISHGAFDPTVGPLVKLWGFSGGKPPSSMPGSTSIADALAQVGYTNIIVNVAETPPTARLAKPGIAVDLGGIAKGYAVDACHAALVTRDAQQVMIDLGGNIRCIGAASGERKWRIGVRNPFNRDEIIGSIDLPGGMAVATSGNYERFVAIGGERFSHIIDPRTGYPVQGMAGVTALASTAVEADAMSTALFVLGPEQGRAALEATPGCRALYVPDEQPIRILLTPGMAPFFTPIPSLRNRVFPAIPRS